MDFETEYVEYKDSAIGKLQGAITSQHTERIDELQKLREDFEKYRGDEAAYRAEQDRILHAERLRNTVASAVIGFLTASLANILAYYWPYIVSFAASLFHG